MIEQLFFAKYERDARLVEFDRTEIVTAASGLGLDVAKNLGDLVYTYKYRRDLPERIRATAPEGEEWRLVNAGRARYKFMLGKAFRVEPDFSLVETKVPDSTPGIIAKYALSDEQALLAKLRYNRLIDIFTGVTCYSLQNHLRTSVQVDPEANETMQIETDEIYVGIDRRGAHYVFPVQAKGGSDKIAIQQIEQDVLLCQQKFKELICIPIAAQFMPGDAIALFAFESSNDGIRKSMERHYRLVPKDEIGDQDLRTYRQRLNEDS
ncbi:MAG: endonuclease [Vulcanimicrobiaceae bacterium]